ncbi:hypothetical protein [Streptomyces sp. A5-4]|uniref:hypothetical protein n=1 Tax=Streptomyces sp. A5-4 TaxID=3384771 RepID=UPI003DA8D9C2
MIETVRVTVIGDSERVTVQVVWAGGHRTDGEIIRPVGRLDQLSYYPQLAARARELAAAGRSAREIAQILNEEGFRPPKRPTISEPREYAGCCGIWAASAPMNRPSAGPRLRSAVTNGG